MVLFHSSHLVFISRELKLVLSLMNMTPASLSSSSRFSAVFVLFAEIINYAGTASLKHLHWFRFRLIADFCFGSGSKVPSQFELQKVD